MADAFVLRPTWTGREIAEGQFRRGYFEQFGGDVGLALDNVIRPLFPNYLVTNDGSLGVPPGASAIAPLTAGTEYAVTSDSVLAPYVVIGVEIPLTPGALDLELLPGEARLAGARSPGVREGRLVLLPWDPTRPWRDDAARLSLLHDTCAASDGGSPLIVTADREQLEIRLGRCAVAEPLPDVAGATPLLAALAGPDWITVSRKPGWIAHRWFLWLPLAAVIVRVAAMWWSFGLVSAAAVSAVLAGAVGRWPVATTMTWAMMLILSIAAAIVRAAVLALRRLPQRWRVPSAVAVLALVSWTIVAQPRQPTESSPIMRIRAANGQPDACALVGYSTVQGASLRRGIGGVRWFVDEECAPCRDKTAALAAGGETFAWLHDAYCSSAASFGANGLVAFLGGANDDFFWGVLSLARWFVVREQGIEGWRSNLEPAAAASLARVDAQVTALGHLIACAHARGARFLFLNDFLISDLPAGREANRAAMLARRRAAVEAAGGTFVDLLQVFSAEAGIAWFNDYVHPSLVAHRRIAELVCRAAP